MFHLTGDVDRNFFNFYMKGFFNAEKLDEMISCYTTSGIRADIAGDAPEYRKTASAYCGNESRYKDGFHARGSYFVQDGKKLFSVGRIQGKDIIIDADAQKIVSPKNADGEIRLKEFCDGSCVFDIGNGRYTVTYDFIQKSLSADTVSDEELALLDSYFENKCPDTDLRADEFYEENKLKAKYRNLSSDDQNYGMLMNAITGLNMFRYEKADVTIEYSRDALYDVSDGNLRLLSHKQGAGADLEYSSSPLEFPDKTSTFNSRKDFSTENLIDSKEGVLLLHTKSDGQKISMQTDEFLYGGKNGWFYGIWTGSEAEHKFTETSLRNIFRNSDSKNNYADLCEKESVSENDIKSAGSSKADAMKNATHGNSEYSFTCLLPEKNDVRLEGAKSEYLDETISDEGGTLKSSSRILKSCPYISADGIQCNRLGGASYFMLDSIPENSDSARKVLQKTLNSGTDITSGPQVSVLGISTPTSSTNKGDSWMVQSLQDVNSDRIPDVLKIVGKECHVYFGSVDSQGNIEYPSSPSMKTQTVKKLSDNHNESSSTGFSFSPSGAIHTIYSASGRQKGISLTNGIGGSTFGGTNETSASLIDINADGIADYVDGGTVHLGKGNGYEEFFEYGWKNISEGAVTGHSSNLSIGNSLPLGGTSGSSAQDISGGVSVSGDVGGCLSISSSVQKRMLMDVNGDGLVDVVQMTDDDGDQKNSVYDVFFNTGSKIDSTAAPFKLRIPRWKNKGPGTLEVNNSAINSNKISYGKTDVQLEENSSAELKEFSNDIDGLDCSITASVNVSGNLAMNMNVSIPIGFVKLNITANVGGGINSGSTATSATVKMIDLDGDGLSDHVLKISGDDAIWWKRNLAGKVGLLKQINMPQGGNIEIEYAEQYGTRDNPNFKHVMSKVTMNDGTDGKGLLPKLEHGSHTVTTLYSYDGGYYDRRRKDFYGFRKVTTTFADGTSQIDEYYNDAYYRKGCMEESRSYSKDNILLSRSRTVLCHEPFALPQKEESWAYEKGSGNNCIHTVTEYEYDDFGNCTDIIQQFDDGTKLKAEIKYDNSNTTDYIVGLPVDIKVYGTKGQLLRHRAGKYDGKGQLEKLYQYYDKSGYAESSLSYDGYGNIKSVSDSRGAKISYEYDVNIENMFITGISQSGSGTDTYTSSIEYNFDTQTKKSETDCNGNILRYEYDGWQRIKQIFTAYDDEIPAVSYEYYTPTEAIDGKRNLWYAVTSNKVTFDAKDCSIINTVMQVDGLGRAVRTAKTGCVNGVDGWNASGAVEYDEKGRTLKAGMTEFIKGDVEALLSSTPKMTSLFTSYEYDDKDRQILTKLPDGSVQTNTFYIEENKLISESTDPLGNVSVQETDSHGNIVRVARKDKTGKELTEVTYRYNEMGEMLKAFDAKGHPISVEYDLLGRRTALESLDSGRQEFFYDKCSNLVKENNSVLREQNKQIVYEYDGQNRLVKIDYPDTEDTLYTYGRANDSHGAAGKILSIKDASGTISYEYGKLGEVTKETRVLANHLARAGKTETAIMEYRSDYLGRMQWIVYPDGEKVIYGYDNGGQVISVTGEHWGEKFKYVIKILYDEYGQRTRIEYGNGTSTDYKYDPARRWLDTIKTENSKGKTFQNISYTFDRVGNVLNYENVCLDSVTGNYKTSQTYSYDDLYQLIRVDGNTTYNPYHSYVPEFESAYSQVFEFDSDGLGNMTGKISSETVSPQKSIGDNLNYNFDYVYDKDYAHRLVNVGDRYYKYDSNGNIICEQDGSFNEEGTVSYHKITQEAENVYSTNYGWGLFKDSSSGRVSSAQSYRRTYTWNEKNQLINSVDANYSTSYVYGQDGQRSNKYTASSETLYFNKMWTLHTDSGNIASGGQYAKNVYLGDTRIVTKLHGARENTIHEEYYKQYFYHSDHLGSATMISDYKGDEYQRIEYTPYGETWVEKTQNTGSEFLPYKFTGKEMDEETGLYYYGARYLDPKYSRWISTDPALGEYIPQAPVSDEARKHNQNLPGMGGVFNHINGDLYAYTANNPVKYTDPDGKAATAGITLREALKLGLRKIAPKAGLATLDGPSPVLDVVLSLWFCYDVYQIYKNYQAHENSTQYDSEDKQSPIPHEGAKSGEEVPQKEHKKIKAGSGKERADDVPSWAEGESPYEDESGKDFSKRLMDKKYGENNYDKGPGSEYNKLKKWGDRGFE
ncbi:MAG: toxin TcdB middle/N-terminal domain-containing protein [Treponema sp.]|nr:toxin TcdB middle/N-terminal domain-containing protein [Treponema sp.]